MTVQLCELVFCLAVYRTVKAGTCEYSRSEVNMTSFILTCGVYIVKLKFLRALVAPELVSPFSCSVVLRLPSDDQLHKAYGAGKLLSAASLINVHVHA